MAWVNERSTSLDVYDSIPDLIHFPIVLAYQPSALACTVVWAQLKGAIYLHERTGSNLINALHL